MGRGTWLGIAWYNMIFHGIDIYIHTYKLYIYYVYYDLFKLCIVVLFCPLRNCITPCTTDPGCTRFTVPCDNNDIWADLLGFSEFKPLPYRWVCIKPQYIREPLMKLTTENIWWMLKGRQGVKWMRWCWECLESRECAESDCTDTQIENRRIYYTVGGETNNLPYCCC